GRIFESRHVGLLSVRDFCMRHACTSGGGSRLEACWGAMAEGATSGRRLQRDQAVSRVLWIVLLLNLGGAALKLGMGWATGALSLLADGVHALLNASSNVVGLVGIAVASRPADAGHPYSHRRFETLAAVSIGLLILSGMVGVVQGIWQGIADVRPLPH